MSYAGTVLDMIKRNNANRAMQKKNQARNKEKVYQFLHDVKTSENHGLNTEKFGRNEYSERLLNSTFHLPKHSKSVRTQFVILLICIFSALLFMYLFL